MWIPQRDFPYYRADAPYRTAAHGQPVRGGILSDSPNCFQTKNYKIQKIRNLSDARALRQEA